MYQDNISLSIIVRGKPITEYPHKGQTFVEGRSRSNYEIELRNNNPFRVVAVISVDGRSVLDGESAGENSSGYLLEAYQSYRIPGWRLDGEQAAKFAFVDPQESYAAQSGDGSVSNVGIIGAMVFREKIVTPSVAHPLIWPSVHGLPNMPDFPDLPKTYPFVPWDHFYYNGGVLRGMNNGYFGPEILASSACCSNVDSNETTLGTAFGEATTFKTTSVKFERAEMISLMVIRYEGAKALRARGIVIGRHAKQSVEPQAFPAMKTGCVPPNDWKKG